MRVQGAGDGGMSDPAINEEDMGEEYCDLCGNLSNDCTLLPDTGQLVCNKCFREQLGQMTL